MTEIKIERKKKPVWPWILLLIIVALLGWAIYEFAIRDNHRAFLPAAPATNLVATTSALAAPLLPYKQV
jgi:hypothetical protein